MSKGGTRPRAWGVGSGACGPYIDFQAGPDCRSSGPYPCDDDGREAAWIGGSVSDYMRVEIGAVLGAHDSFVAACVSALAALDPTRKLRSYSDPSVGHSGALYRACNWIWAPTWHVLREPPTGGGIRGGKVQRAKHRWVFLLAPDPAREDALRLRDEAIERKMPWAGYIEPAWRRGVPKLVNQDRFKRWAANGGTT